MAVDGSTAEGYFKDRYGQLETTIPEHVKIAKAIKYEQRERLGENYQFPVRMQRAHGVTFASGSTSLTAFTLNAVKSGQLKEASISGSSFVGRESFAYKAVLSASAKGPQAFGDLFDEGVEDLYNTAWFYLEMMLLYGTTSIGAFAAAGSSAATQDIALTAASSAPGLWTQMVGAYIDVYDVVAYTTKRNTSNNIEVTGVDYDQSTGQITLSLSGNATELDSIAAADIIVPKGAASAMMSGLDKLITATTGTVNGISVATYKQWRGNTYSVGSAAATFGKITRASVQPAVWCGSMDVDCFISTATWADLNNNTAALRQLTKHEGKVELGTSELVYHGPVGLIRIMPHAMVKGGEFFMGSCSRNAKRVGASDVTFNLGVEGQNARFLMELSNSAGFEIRTMWDQGVFLRKPRGWVKGTAIVNSN